MRLRLGWASATPQRRTNSASGASSRKSKPLLYALIVILILGIGLLLYGWWDTNRFDVRRVEIELDCLPQAFDGFTVLITPATKYR